MKAVVAIARSRPERADNALQEGVAGARPLEAKELVSAPPPGPASPPSGPAPAALRHLGGLQALGGWGQGFPAPRSFIPFFSLREATSGGRGVGVAWQGPPLSGLGV